MKKQMRAKRRHSRQHPEDPRRNELFFRADKQWDRGHLISAFRLFLAGAKAGDKDSQVNVGFFYDSGVGVHPNRKKALYWYNKAYRQGDALAAYNIGRIR